MSIPLGGGLTSWLSIFTSTYLNLFNKSFFLSYSCFAELAVGSSGFMSSNFPSGLKFRRLGFPQNSIHVDILIFSIEFNLKTDFNCVISKGK